MRKQIGNFIFGMGLIVFGLLLFAREMGWVNIDRIEPIGWAIIFGAISLFFFIIYFYSGISEWGLLFPAFISAGIGGTIYLALVGYRDPSIASIVLLSCAAPFLVAFILDRRRWWALIPTWVLGVIALIPAIANRVPGEAIAAVLMFSFSLPFIVVFLARRDFWWALISAWVFFVIGMIVIGAEKVPGEFIAAGVMLSIALPFLVVYLRDRSRVWALIPAGILIVVGAIPVIVMAGGETAAKWIGPVFLVLLGGSLVLWGTRRKPIG